MKNYPMPGRRKSDGAPLQGLTVTESERLNFILDHFANQILEIAYCQQDHTTLYRMPGQITFHDTKRAAIDAGINAEKMRRLV